MGFHAERPGGVQRVLDQVLPKASGADGYFTNSNSPLRYAGRGGAGARAPGLLNVDRAARLAAAGALLAPTAAAVAARRGAAGGDAVLAGDAAGGALRC